MSIQPNEIRLGNAVYHVYAPSDGEGGTNYWIIGVEDIVSILRPRTSNFHYEGIPLTVEILDKTEFKFVREQELIFSTKTSRLYKLAGIYVYIYSDGKVQVSTGSGSNNHRHIQYLHQLQNLFFILKNKELVINL